MMQVILYYGVVVIMAAVVTFLFSSEAVKVNTKGTIIISSLAVLAFMCLFAASFGWWHILGLIAAYILVSRIVIIILESSKKNRD